MKKIVILLLALPVLLKAQATDIKAVWVDPYLVDRIEAMDYKYKGADWEYDFQPGTQLDQISALGLTLGDPIRMIRYKDKIFLLVKTNRSQLVVQIGVTNREYFRWVRREGFEYSSVFTATYPVPTKVMLDNNKHQIYFRPVQGYEKEFEADNAKLFKLDY